MGLLHDDIILLLRPESFRVLLSCASKGFFIWPSLGLTNLNVKEKKKKNGKDSGRSSEMTPLCKWPILWRDH